MNKELTCDDCRFRRMCTERRGICTSFRQSNRIAIKEKLLSMVCFGAICILFAFMLYAASEGTWKALVIGVIGIIPSGTVAVYISNNMISYEEELSDE